MKRTRILLIAAAIVVAGVVFIAVLPDGQPSYQGRKLVDWVDELQNNGPGSPDWLTGSNAVYHIGTNGIPFFLKWMQAKDSGFKAKIVSNWNGRVDYQFRIRTEEERHMMAWFAFGVLGENSKPAWPLFIKWTEDRDANMRRRGLEYLYDCKANKAVFVPVAERLLKDPEPSVWSLSAIYFQLTFPEEAKAAGADKIFPAPNSNPTTGTNTPGKVN